VLRKEETDGSGSFFGKRQLGVMSLACLEGMNDHLYLSILVHFRLFFAHLAVFDINLIITRLLYCS
jgi:hypothetical protein